MNATVAPPLPRLIDISGARDLQALARSTGQFQRDVIEYLRALNAPAWLAQLEAQMEALEAAGGGAGAVSSVFGRTGAVVAQANDYAASEVDNDSSVPGGDVAAALDQLDGDIDDVVNDLATLGSDDVANDSGVDGGAGSVSDALEYLEAAIDALATPIGTTWDPDAPPASPNSADDEFPGTSLDAKWGTWDVGGDLSVAVQDSYCKLTVASFATGNGRACGIYQPAPGTAAWALAAKVSFQSVLNGAVAFRIGLMVAEDLAANPTTANSNIVNVLQNNSPIVGTGSVADYTAAFSTGVTLSRVDRSVYFRGRVSGTTNIAWDWSDDGVGWNQLQSLALGYTPAAMGLWFRNATGSVAYAIVHWFRVASGAVDLDDLLPGGREVGIFV